MKVTSYHGFGIHVNEDSGLFSIQKGWYTDEEPFTAPTLKKLKSLIDAFAKSNKGWTPRLMHKFDYQDTHLPANETVKVIGINKEGCFVIEEQTEDGTETNTVYGWAAEGNIIEIDPRNASIIAEIKALYDEMEALERKATVLSASLHRKTLRDLRAELGIVDNLDEFRT